MSAEGTAELAMQVQQIAASMAAMQGQLQQLSLRSAEAASAAADTASASLPAVDMGEQLGALLAELSALKGSPCLAGLETCLQGGQSCQAYVTWLSS